MAKACSGGTSKFSSLEPTLLQVVLKPPNVSTKLQSPNDTGYLRSQGCEEFHSIPSKLERGCIGARKSRPIKRSTSRGPAARLNSKLSVTDNLLPVVTEGIWPYTCVACYARSRYVSVREPKPLTFAIVDIQLDGRIVRARGTQAGDSATLHFSLVILRNWLCIQ